MKTARKFPSFCFTFQARNENETMRNFLSGFKFLLSYHQSFKFKCFDPSKYTQHIHTQNPPCKHPSIFSLLNFLGIKIGFHRFASCSEGGKRHRKEIDILVVSSLCADDFKWNVYKVQMKLCNECSSHDKYMLNCCCCYCST